MLSAAATIHAAVPQESSVLAAARQINQSGAPHASYPRVSFAAACGLLLQVLPWYNFALLQMLAGPFAG